MHATPMSTLREINEYLFHEFDDFGPDDDESYVSDDWPFNLQFVGSFTSPYGERRVYQFSREGEAYYVIDGYYLTFDPAAGLSLIDLRLEEIGSVWIGEQEPIDLDTVQIGDENVPPLPVRRAAIQQIADSAIGQEGEVKILEGLFLRRSRRYLALIEGPTGEVFIVTTGMSALPAPNVDVWPHRRLALGVGALVETGQLEP